MELNGRTALVTGGARRIGRALCLALAERGVRVAVHCFRSEEAGMEVARRCPRSILLDADLADPDVPETLVDEALRRFGRLDILINNAAVYEHTPLEEVDDAAWERTMAVNLRAPFFLAKRAGLSMREKGGGVIVNLTDWAIARPYPAYLPYYAAKAGLASLTAGLARALAPDVRVNAVAPGAILAPAGRPEVAEKAAKAALLGRLGGEEAIVSAVLFLIGNDFVTGETVVVDGGRSVR